MKNSHFKLCFDPARPDTENSTPAWPLVIINRDGQLFDAATIRGSVAAIIGSEYLDAQDETDDWLLRVEHARREAMLGTMADLQVRIIDNIKGVIPDNYTASEDDPEYALNPDLPIIDLNVTTERSYLFSLAIYGAIRLLQRADVSVLQDITTDGNDPEMASEQRGLDYIEFSPAELTELMTAAG